jgi:hypothetical protein
MVLVRVEAEVRPTESVEKVKQAVLAFFEPDTIKVEDLGDEYKILYAESRSLQSLAKLHEKLRSERILDAARAYMVRGVSGAAVMFKLNKQAAYVGRISFVDADSEAPLGPITVVIEHRDPMAVVDWLAPPTKMGRPIYEKAMPTE